MRRLYQPSSCNGCVKVPLKRLKTSIWAKEREKSSTITTVSRINSSKVCQEASAGYLIASGAEHTAAPYTSSSEGLQHSKCEKVVLFCTTEGTDRKKRERKRSSRQARSCYC